jgi:hypothetical protein
MLNYHDESRVFLHPLAGYEPPDMFAFRSDNPSPEVMETIVDRLIDYYHHLVSEVDAKGIGTSDDMWRALIESYGDFEQAFQTRDRAKVADTMVNLCRHPTLVHGFMHYTATYREILEDPVLRRKESLFLIDKLLALGDALGILSVQTPEQGQWGCKDVNVGALLGEIQGRVPFDIRPPQAGGGTFGLNTHAGVLSMKDVQAIYATVRVREILASVESKSVCEIGGGAGGLAYYLAKAGVERVSVFDLPLVSLIQAYYLMRSLGADQVSLHGEKTDARVRVMPFWALEDEPADACSLVINIDSLPEIERDTALNYVRLIREKGSHFFWSVNQEGRGPNAGTTQNVVWELVERSGGFRRIHRYPHWLRAGWVEELYEIQ